MRPLREQRGAEDPAIARAAELVRAGRPTAPSTAVRARVWQRLATPERRRGSARLPRFAVAGVLVVCALSIGAAGLAWRHRARIEGAPPVPASPSAPVKRAISPSPKPSPPVVTPPPVSPAPSPREMTPRRTPSRSRMLPPPDVASAPSDPAIAVKQIAPAGPEAADDALVFAAMAALRQRHDAAAARDMLTDYLRRRPDGALAEEACYLAIEAASDENERAAAARRYLARFPDGRYRERASRAAGATGP